PSRDRTCSSSLIYDRIEARRARTRTPLGSARHAAPWRRRGARGEAMALRWVMGDIDDKISDATDKARDSRLNSVIAVFVALTATFMALNNVKDGNIVQVMQQAQANGVDAWAYYQAKGTKGAQAHSA